MGYAPFHAASAQSPSLPTPADFAGMLATLAAPAAGDASPAKASSESDLGEDVVTLSYESALRANARYTAPERRDWAPEPTTRVDESVTPRAGCASQDIFDRDLRTTSVTVRLSKAECARLHQLATEAGVTVSAYLRSCTFEAEALRAEVKATLAELRSPAMKVRPRAPERARRPVFGWVAFGWLARLLPHRRSASQAC